MRNTGWGGRRMSRGWGLGADLVLGDPIWDGCVMCSAFSQGPEDIPAVTKKPSGFLPGDEAHLLSLGRETNL